MTLIYISSFSILLPLIEGIFLYKFLKNGERTFLFYLIITALFEAVLLAMMLKHKNNHSVVNAFILVEFVLLSLTFKKCFMSLGIRIPYAISLTIFILLWVINVYLNGFGYLNQYVLTLERLFLMIMSGYFLIQLMKKTEVSPLISTEFWIASGIFIYFTTTIIIYSTLTWMIHGNNQELAKYFNYFNTTINTFANIIYSIGFLCILPKVKQYFS